MEEGGKGNVLVQRRNRAPSWSWASVDGEIKFYPRLHADAESTTDIDGILFDYRKKQSMIDKFHGGCCSLRLRAMIAERLEICGVDRYKFLPFAPSRPRYLLVLHDGSKRVGWASFDEPFRGEPGSPKLHCIRIMSMGMGDNHRCYVLITEQGESSEHARLGMGCIWRTEVFDNIPPKVISIS